MVKIMSEIGDIVCTCYLEIWVGVLDMLQANLLF